MLFIKEIGSYIQPK